MHWTARTKWRVAGALLVCAGWGAFVASFFLPATNVLERGGTAAGTPLSGWDAMWSSVTVPAAQPLVILVEPRVLLFLLFPLLNLFVLLSPVVAFGAPGRAWFLALVLVPAAVVPVVLPKMLTGDVFVGFYLWLGSFVVVAAGCVVVSLAWRDGERRGLKSTAVSGS